MEVFRKAFTVVDDIAAVCAKIFDYAGINDEKSKQHVPNYEPVVSKIRLGLRNSKYLLNPMENIELVSIDNNQLNPDLSDLFKNGVTVWDSDIRNILRQNDIKLGYNAKNKIEILKSDIGKTKNLKTKENELKNEIKTMISLIDDAEEQLHWKQIYDESKNKEEESMEPLLQDLLKHISCVRVS